MMAYRRASSQKNHRTPGVGGSIADQLKNQLSKSAGSQKKKGGQATAQSQGHDESKNTKPEKEKITSYTCPGCKKTILPNQVYGLHRDGKIATCCKTCEDAFDPYSATVRAEKVQEDESAQQKPRRNHEHLSHHYG